MVLWYQTERGEGEGEGEDMFMFATAGDMCRVRVLGATAHGVDKDCTLVGLLFGKDILYRGVINILAHFQKLLPLQQ